MSYPLSKPLLGRYDIISPRLGGGAFGTIALGRDIKTSELVAIKTILDSEWDETEHKSLAQLSHPNVLRLREYCNAAGKHYLVTDYLPGGDLFDFLEGKPHIEEDIVRPLFCQIVACTEFFHRAGYAHRDLKLENIFLDKDRRNVTIGDWGFSVRYTPGLPTLRERCGTLFYLAPEMITGAGYEGPEVDMWSLGVLLYYLLVGYLPFDAGTNEETERLIILASPDIPDRLSPEAQHLLRSLLRPAHDRFTALQTLTHPWLQGQSMATSSTASSSSSFSSLQNKRVTSYRPASSSSPYSPSPQSKRSRPIISSSSFFEDSPFDCLLGASLDDLSPLSCCPPSLDRCLNPCLPQTNTVC